MLKILLATTSAHKIIEFTDLNTTYHNKFELISLHALGSENDDAPETNNTFEANALQKADYYWKKYHIPVLCDDSGLEVFNLNNFPGVNSKRWLEKSGFNFKTNELLKMLKKQASTAQYVCALAYRDQNYRQVFIGKFVGKLVKPQNTNGFGFDNAFYVEKHRKTFDQITLEDKNKISHRAQAFKQFLQWIDQIY